MNGTEIRQQREALHLSQRELADRAGISDETLRKIEHERPVGEGSLRRVVAALGMAAAPSVPPHSVEVADRQTPSGRGVVTVRVAALGVEVETTFDSSEDRARVVAEIMRAVGIDNGENDNADSGGDSTGGAPVPRRP